VNMKKLIPTVMIVALLAISVQDLYQPRFAAAQPSDCNGMDRHCIDIQECTDPTGLIELIFDILGLELEVCITNHYYYP